MHYTADFCMRHYARFLQIGSHMLPLTYKGFKTLLLIYINTLSVKPLRCISTLWLGKYVRYTLANSFEVWLQWDKI